MLHHNFSTFKHQEVTSIAWNTVKLKPNFHIYSSVKTMLKWSEFVLFIAYSLLTRADKLFIGLAHYK